MYRRFHERFGTAGVVIAIIALVAALGGTAIAAGGKLTSKEKKEVTKIAKKYAGKPGAPGPAGANGTNGKDGAQGAPGKDGADGVSVTSASLSEGNLNCEFGGSEFTASNGTTYACNGELGEAGETGFTETLPSGETETGTWANTFNVEGFAVASFAIPLAAELDSSHVVVVGEGEAAEPECDNGAGEAPSPANPEADPGFLCVFVTAFGGGGSIPTGGIIKTTGAGSGAGKTGALISLASAGADVGFGTFAVTGK